MFGTYQFFQPNTQTPTNPFDFHRVVAGVAYRYSPALRFAIDSQNLLYRYDRFTFPASALASFNPALADANPNGIANAVPRSIKALFLNFEFSF